jgi:(p)ppGpp synthase/HD superfamily hydrolase
MFNSRLIEAAVHISALGHSSQHRKNAAASLYITHPISVALICAQFGIKDERVLAAAIMHDVIEDTTFSVNDIEQMMMLRFHCDHESVTRILNVISDLSEVKKDNRGNKLSWKIRKTEHIARLRHASDDALIVKAADTYHNILCLLDDCDVSGFAAATSVFNTDAASLLWYWKQTADLLSQRNSVILSDLKTRLLDAINKFENIEKQYANKTDSLSRA